MGRGFENTFASACASRRLAGKGIAGGTEPGAISYGALPSEVRRAVGAEVERWDWEGARRPPAGTATRGARVPSTARTMRREIAHAPGAAQGAGSPEERAP